MDRPAWWCDEMRHPGVDYDDPAQVAEYDRRHGQFHDYRKDAEAVVRPLGLRSDQTVLDMGAGTGAFALHAASCCRRVFAVDVFEAMLAYCRQKAAERKVENIAFRRGGFLTYEHADEPVDAVVSVAVLHHLPDFWKSIGLRRVRGMLKPGGNFYLFDVVFPGAEEEIRERIGDWVRGMKDAVGPEFAAEVETHVRDEFSTYDWIMEGLLERAGFRIDRADSHGGFGTAYLCLRVD
jgi:putative AdoMet-dependent methyltransferase